MRPYHQNNSDRQDLFSREKNSNILDAFQDNLQTKNPQQQNNYQQPNNLKSNYNSELEREKRIKLRDEERFRRLNGIQASAYEAQNNYYSQQQVQQNQNVQQTVTTPQQNINHMNQDYYNNDKQFNYQNELKQSITQNYTSQPYDNIVQNQINPKQELDQHQVMMRENQRKYKEELDQQIQYQQTKADVVKNQINSKQLDQEEQYQAMMREKQRRYKDELDQQILLKKQSTIQTPNYQDLDKEQTDFFPLNQIIQKRENTDLNNCKNIDLKKQQYADDLMKQIVDKQLQQRVFTNQVEQQPTNAQLQKTSQFFQYQGNPAEDQKQLQKLKQQQYAEELKKQIDQKKSNSQNPRSQLQSRESQIEQQNQIKSNGKPSSQQSDRNHQNNTYKPQDRTDNQTFYNNGFNQNFANVNRTGYNQFGAKEPNETQYSSVPDRDLQTNRTLYSQQTNRDMHSQQDNQFQQNQNFRDLQSQQTNRDIYSQQDNKFQQNQNYRDISSQQSKRENYSQQNNRPSYSSQSSREIQNDQIINNFGEDKDQKEKMIKQQKLQYAEQLKKQMEDKELKKQQLKEKKRLEDELELKRLEQDKLQMQQQLEEENQKKLREKKQLQQQNQNQINPTKQLPYVEQQEKMKQSANLAQYQEQIMQQQLSQQQQSQQQQQQYEYKTLQRDEPQSIQYNTQPFSQQLKQSQFQNGHENYNNLGLMYEHDQTSDIQQQIVEEKKRIQQTNYEKEKIMSDYSNQIQNLIQEKVNFDQEIQKLRSVLDGKQNINQNLDQFNALLGNMKIHQNRQQNLFQELYQGQLQSNQYQNQQYNQQQFGLYQYNQFQQFAQMKQHQDPYQQMYQNRIENYQNRQDNYYQENHQQMNYLNQYQDQNQFHPQNQYQQNQYQKQNLHQKQNQQQMESKNRNQSIVDQSIALPSKTDYVVEDGASKLLEQSFMKDLEAFKQIHQNHFEPNQVTTINQKILKSQVKIDQSKKQMANKNEKIDEDYQIDDINPEQTQQNLQKLTQEYRQNLINSHKNDDTLQEQIDEDETSSKVFGKSSVKELPEQAKTTQRHRQSNINTNSHFTSKTADAREQKWKELLDLPLENMESKQDLMIDVIPRDLEQQLIATNDYSYLMKKNYQNDDSDEEIDVYDDEDEIQEEQDIMLENQEDQLTSNTQIQSNEQSNIQPQAQYNVVQSQHQQQVATPVKNHKRNFEQNTINKIYEISNQQTQQLIEISRLLSEQQKNLQASEMNTDYKQTQSNFKVEEEDEDPNNNQSIKTDDEEQYYSDEWDHNMEQNVKQDRAHLDNFLAKKLQNREKVEGYEKQVEFNANYDNYGDDKSLLLINDDNDMEKMQDFIESNNLDDNQGELIINDTQDDIENHDEYIDSNIDAFKGPQFDDKKQSGFRPQSYQKSDVNCDSKKSFKRPKTYNIFGNLSKNDTTQTKKQDRSSASNLPNLIVCQTIIFPMLVNFRILPIKIR